MLVASVDDCVELHASSGTTGTPVTVCYTRGNLEVWSEVMARCLSMSGLTEEAVFFRILFLMVLKKLVLW